MIHFLWMQIIVVGMEFGEQFKASYRQVEVLR